MPPATTASAAAAVAKGNAAFAAAAVALLPALAVAATGGCASEEAGASVDCALPTAGVAAAAAAAGDDYQSAVRAAALVGFVDLAARFSAAAVTPAEPLLALAPSEQSSVVRSAGVLAVARLLLGATLKAWPVMGGLAIPTSDTDGCVPALGRYLLARLETKVPGAVYKLLPAMLFAWAGRDEERRFRRGPGFFFGLGRA